MSVDNRFCHQGSSQQQMVVAAIGNAEATIWKVKACHEAGDITTDGSTVRRGDVIRLEHIATRRNLHSHNRVAPIDKSQQEVTACGENGRADHRDNWVVEPEVGNEWLEGQPLRLIHQETKKALHSHVNSDQLFTAGFQEVTGFGGRDENDLWVCNHEDQPASKSAPLAFHQQPWFQVGLPVLGLLVACVGTVFQITGPLPQETLKTIPGYIGVITRFFASYGIYVACLLFVLLGLWKRAAISRGAIATWNSLCTAYIVSLAFLLRPVFDHLEITQLRIIRAEYGARGTMKNVTRILRQAVRENSLELTVTNEVFGGDPIPGVPKELHVEYVYFRTRRQISMPEGQMLKLPTKS